MPGFKGLSVPGPTNMPFHVRQAMDIALEDHRAPDFPKFTLPLFADLKEIFQTKSGQIFIFPGSGTGGWESAVANTLSRGDKVLASVFGQFSLLWVDLCQRFGLDVDAIDVEWGKGVPLDQYRQRLAADKQTATGVTSDVAGVRKILDELNHPAMLFVDGVSSVASIDFRMDEWGVDVAVAGSQKGFMLPTGLAIVCVSQKALKAGEAAKLPRCFFDYRDMIKANAQGYFPYTPATTLLRGLRASVDMLLEEGLENVFARHKRLASAVRAAVEAWGLRTCAQGPQWHSDTVTAVVVPEGFDANDVIKRAYYRYDLSLGTGLNKVNGKVFRIGHLGWLNEIMVMQTLGGVELAMRDAAIPFEPGAGVGAAVRYLSEAGQGVQMAAE
jgi:alanine-glyoxylate transaminase / serine-glyoxylate transaminase / serine-pyruvate transaminase